LCCSSAQEGLIFRKQKIFSSSRDGGKRQEHLRTFAMAGFFHCRPWGIAGWSDAENQLFHQLPALGKTWQTCGLQQCLRIARI
jgi:hypothetical protein